MNEILSTAIVLTVLVAALAGLVAWVRNDTFTGRAHRQPSVAPEVDTVVPDRQTTTTRVPSPARGRALQAI